MKTLAVIGLGYVGLPLVVEFGKQMRTIGFDIAKHKVEACRRGTDPSRELDDAQMAEAKHAIYTDDPAMLGEADMIIIAVPTPVDQAHIPDFRPLIGSSASVGRHMKKGVTVIYESTVYPGATEEVCIPVLEKESGMKWKEGFLCRLQPRAHQSWRQGAHAHQDPEDRVRGHAADAGTAWRSSTRRSSSPACTEPSIKAAEAAKVIENTQRDLNIALMNELAIIFDKIGIDTSEVLEAAGTKWNFLKFKPGLVGGHCIGVDPYYLTHKADMLGYHPQVILAGRRINDGMGKFIAEQTIKHMIAAGSYIKGAKVNVLGLTFKENCGDLRNSKVIDIIKELQSYGVDVHVTDPTADPEEAMHEYGVKLEAFDDLPRADAVVAAVAHREYKSLSIEDLSKKMIKGGAFIDVKAAFDPSAVTGAGYKLWRL